MASHLFYSVCQHKPIVQCILSFLSNRDVFRLFAVSARLRSMWYIEYERLKRSQPFERRAEQVRQAREWRKALDLPSRIFVMTGELIDIHKCDPMKRMRTLVRQDKKKQEERQAKRIKV